MSPSLPSFVVVNLSQISLASIIKKDPLRGESELSYELIRVVGSAYLSLFTERVD